MFWIKQVEEMENMERNRVQLNLQINKGGVLECQGRIQRQNPIYLPDCHAIMAKIVNKEHLKTVHWGIEATMTRVREQQRP